MDENLYLQPLSYAGSAALMMELSQPHPPAKVMVLQSKINEPMPKDPNRRKAKRVGDKAAEAAKWQKFKEQMKLEQAAKAKLKAQRVFEEMQAAEQRLQQKLMDRQGKIKKPSQATITRYMPADNRTGGHREMYLKPIEAKNFIPIIGKVNAAGQTPVQIDAKTTIMISPGRDIEQTIAKYKKILNIK